MNWAKRPFRLKDSMKPGSARRSNDGKRNVRASLARNCRWGLSTKQTDGYDVDYAEIVGCTSVDDGGTSATFPLFPLIVILLVGNVML